MFKTVEIDSTFYRYPSKGAVMGWLKYSPGDFVFSAKLPKIITHDKKLGLKGEVKIRFRYLFGFDASSAIRRQIGLFANSASTQI